jgi:transmembrane sensor
MMNMPVQQMTGQSMPPLDRGIARQAAEWFILFSEGELSQAQQQQLDGWRNSHPDHERAWQSAMQVSQRAGKLPTHIGTTVLRRPTRVNRRQAVTTLVMLMTAAPAGWFAYRHMPREGRFTTASGEQRNIVLPDGTRIQLNTATEIDLAYDDNQRLVILRQGEIYIETAPDPLAVTKPARPFSVRTHDGNVRAIGTRYVVRQYADHSHAAVLQGAVEITPTHGNGQVKRLYAGEQAGFTDRSIDAVVPFVQQDALWTSGMLAVENMRLDQFAAELQRYRSGIVRCDPEVAALEITGAFQLNDADGILQNIVALLPVKVVFLTRYWVTIKPA